MITRLLIAAAILMLCQHSQASAEGRVYRDRVEPHWNSQGTSFWYRISLPHEGRQFVLVNAETGTRSPAFDHTKVAAALSGILQRNIQPDQLPVDSLEFPREAAGPWRLHGSAGVFLWTPESQQLQQEAPGDSASMNLFLPPAPSDDSSAETEITLTNKLTFPVVMYWISADRQERRYQTVKPGETCRQHTFSSHVWLLKREDDSLIGCCTATASDNTWNLTEQSLATVSQREPRRARRSRPPAAQQPDNPISPDGIWQPFVREHNLWLRNLSDQQELSLTADGQPARTFRRDAQRARAIGMDYEKADYPDQLSETVWSPNSGYLLALQTTQVDERRVHYIESTPADQLQPRLQSYPYLKPGDPIPQTIPRLFRMADRAEIKLDNSLFPNPWSLDFQRWSDDGTRFWMLYNERGHQRLRLLEVRVADGAVRAVIDESSETFIHYSSAGKMELRWLTGEKVLWASERSGWNHLYLYDLNSDKPPQTVTSGQWNMRRIERLDENTGRLWFFAVGIVDGQNPYHEHFCGVALDGSGLKVLTEGDGMHSIEWSPDRRWFLDRYSRTDLPPVTELRTADGRLVTHLESADATEVIQERGRLPLRFAAPGRDGTTMIWGLLHFPRDFRPGLKYAVVENIYAGPHDHHVPGEFRSRWGHQQQIADAGFLVVQIDGMGTAWRSKAFHDVCWQNLKDAGFPDRIAWMRAAAQAVPQMDLTRIGIYGGSAGGQNAMAALIWHGNFYSAAVADCGCHDNRMDKIWWNEQWLGVPTADVYERNSNRENAAQLQGRLMLVVGELDRNVDPASTIQVARQLVQAEKDFELLVVPGAGHGACETPWASAKRIRFLQQSLGAPK